MAQKNPIMLELKRRIRWAFVFLSLTACIDRITFDLPGTDRQLVVEGMITDQPGPYTVKVSRTFNTREPAFSNTSAGKCKVLLFSDDVFLEELTEVESGVYQTSAGTRGIIGRTYYITIDTEEGEHYISEPELLRPVGAVTNVRFEFESQVAQTTDGTVSADHFNIYADGEKASDPETYSRWRFTGTYHLHTNPELAYQIGPEGRIIPTPFECSGFSTDGVKLIYERPCECCDCWVTETDKSWVVNDPRDVSDEGYRRIFVNQVAINADLFYEKYHVQVEQLSLSPKAYEFYRLLAAQTEGVKSLFQPSIGEISGNIVAVDSDNRALGYFSASAVQSKSIFIFPSDVPYVIGARQFPLRMPCTYTKGASTTKPPFW